MPQPLRLAVDARVVAEDTRGIGRYARAILRRLAVRDDVELTLLTHGPLGFAYRSAYARALESRNFALRARASGKLDVVWHPANGTFFPASIPSVATIHDAVPFRYPDADSKRRAHAQDPFLRSARTAARIIAVSEFGRSEVHAVLGVPTDRIEVIYHGVEPSFAPGIAAPLPAGLIAGRYVLFVGDPIAEPRKNFALLYEAYRRAWPADNGAPRLAVAGARAPELPGVVHVGNLHDDLTARTNEGLRALYRGALALGLASYHETFGMPMVEAMACGTPVIASAASSLPEIGADAALYVPADDPQAWSEALRRVAADASLRDRLRIAGLGRATHFTWEESADKHVALFRSVARA
ncbi:MAG TPA: glycosyltransferase family 1 protein [Candidatus Baltobacteraceae bacterium]|nr:glycosyltransferase family 1 protein [Candidatus Baltobacteraceae bacterium]